MCVIISVILLCDYNTYNKIGRYNMRQTIVYLLSHIKSVGDKY